MKVKPLSASSTSESAAWWLMTGEAVPCWNTKYIYSSHDERQYIEHISGQVKLLIDAAAVAGIGKVLETVLDDLFKQPSGIQK